MAEHALYLVPSDPHYLPSEAKRKEFLAFFQEVSPLPNANGDYYFYVYDEPRLFDGGEAMEAVVCPLCETSLDLYTEEEDEDDPAMWWDRVRDQALEAALTMPCCQGTSRLVDLTFRAPAAYARFAVGALEPSRSEYWEDEEHAQSGLKPETVQRLEKILGCGVLQIWSI